MANYKPNTKGVISRDTITPKRPKLTPPELVILLFFVIFASFFLFCYFESHYPLFFILAIITIALTIGHPLFKIIIVPEKKKRKHSQIYYLELDTVSSYVMTEKVRYVFFNRRHYIIEPFHNISFKSRRTYTVKATTPQDRFPTMKNGENIPLHMATLEKLIEGDVCYLLMREGEDTIIDVFDSKYYIPSPTDFTEYGERYYLSDSHNIPEQ